MDKNLQLIWKKIDNQLSKKELETFDFLLSNDSEFKFLFEKEYKLNQSLKDLKSIKAPHNLLDNIMLAVSKTKYVESYNSFSGIKPILFSIAIVAIVSILIISFMGYPTEISPAQVSIQEFLQTNVNLSQFSLPKEIVVSYLPYTLIFFVGIGLIWLDAILKSRVTLKSA